MVPAVDDQRMPLHHNENVPLWPAVALLLVVFGWLCFTVPAGGFEADQEYWIRWSHRIHSFGLSQVYGGLAGQANYLPVSLLVLTLINHLIGGALSPESVPLVKVATLLFDLALGLVLAGFLHRRGRHPALALVVVANPATLYNSWVWGQIDAMHTAFAAGAWLALSSGQGPLAAALFLLALNTKLQSVVLVPFFLFALAHVLGRRLTAWIATAASCLGVQAALLLPFWNARALTALRHNVFGIVGYFKAVSLNAHNLWYLILADPSQVDDTGRFLGSTYRLWGEGLFALALGLIAVPFYRWIRRLWHDSRLQDLDRTGFLFMGLAGLAFFDLPTEAHERFVHQAVVFFGIDAVLRGRYLFYALVSAFYLVNLEDVLRWRGLGYETFLFDARLGAMAMLALLGVGIWQAYRRTRSSPAPSAEDALA